jgi:hypothetical protein
MAYASATAVNITSLDKPLSDKKLLSSSDLDSTASSKIAGMQGKFDAAMEDGSSNNNIQSTQGISNKTPEVINKSIKLDNNLNPKIDPSQSTIKVDHDPKDKAKSTLGDKIIDKMRHMGNDLTKHHAKLQLDLNQMKTDGLSPELMLSAQVNINKEAIAYDIISKLINKASQNIDQLTKLQ